MSILGGLSSSQCLPCYFQFLRQIFLIFVSLKKILTGAGPGKIEAPFTLSTFNAKILISIPQKCISRIDVCYCFRCPLIEFIVSRAPFTSTLPTSTCTLVICAVSTTSTARNSRTFLTAPLEHVTPSSV